MERAWKVATANVDERAPACRAATWLRLAIRRLVATSQPTPPNALQAGGRRFDRRPADFPSLAFPPATNGGGRRGPMLTVDPEAVRALTSTLPAPPRDKLDDATARIVSDVGAFLHDKTDTTKATALEIVESVAGARATIDEFRAQLMQMRDQVKNDIHQQIEAPLMFVDSLAVTSAAEEVSESRSTDSAKSRGHDVDGKIPSHPAKRLRRRS
jgi:hypothetical protein